MSKQQFKVHQSIRLDQFLTKKLNQSRNQVENFIKNGFVSVENKKQSKVKPGLKLSVDDIVEVVIPNTQKSKPLEVDFEVEVIFEDDYFMVLNKPSGVVVHGAPSVKEATLVDWLKKKGISLSTISGEERHGIVHRLDKGTSGLIVIAKTNEAHTALSKQLENKTMGRYYVAIIDLPLKQNITIEKPIARNPANRLKMGIVANGKNAKTSFLKLQISKNEKIELIAAKLYTGRTHQIRVHLESINRHILGDDLYGFKGKTDKINRVYLHALGLYLNHPITNENMRFEAKLPEDIKNYYDQNFQKENYCEKIDSKYIASKFSTDF